MWNFKDPIGVRSSHKTFNGDIFIVLSALSVAFVLVSKYNGFGHAGCSIYTPNMHFIFWQVCDDPGQLDLTVFFITERGRASWTLMTNTKVKALGSRKCRHVRNDIAHQAAQQHPGSEADKETANSTVAQFTQSQNTDRVNPTSWINEWLAGREEGAGSRRGRRLGTRTSNAELEQDSQIKGNTSGATPHNTEAIPAIPPAAQSLTTTTTTKIDDKQQQQTK